MDSPFQPFGPLAGLEGSVEPVFLQQWDQLVFDNGFHPTVVRRALGTEIAMADAKAFSEGVVPGNVLV